MIETRLLRQFVAVAEELHFHKAALRLHMAQPALSQAINRLEQKLGFALLERDRRGVRRLPAGAAFLQTAYTVLGQLQQGVEHARQVSQGVAGTLTITSVSIAGYPWLLDALKQFRQAFPKVQLVIKEMPSASQAKALITGEADIAFLRRLPGLADHIESRLLLDEPILMALPVDHPDAGNAAIELKDFADADFVFTPQVLGSGYHHQLIVLCEAAGFYPRVVQEADQLHTLIGLVACGFGVALVPESIARSITGDKVVFVPLSVSPSTIGLYLNWSTDNPSPLPGHFFSVLEGAL
ncbi:LysR family transcriptional regulator [Pseudomonas sp. TH34]|jgi:DNA-binding transcriptional LysR family regulator|uniref:LysR family transcriptional regulator n=1 Tax=Pseudomonas yamanorum TaxID=515393 RepID=A0AAJ3H7R4_9PSED|nr:MULTISPECIES: LysR family transcriptional regulator [Pseudomonas]MBK5410662.1 LysR family transcriptional regulator [Pseudomonas sp. TH34]NWD43994.1 LysR family transcriptional regulator [Pseudomonas yamanorum]